MANLALATAILFGLLRGLNADHSTAGWLQNASDNKIIQTLPTLSNWPDCTPATSPIGQLCQSDGKLATSTYRQIRDALRTGVVETQRLCAIDAMVVDAQTLCASSSHAVDASTVSVAALMWLLARNWKEQQTLERADQLYRRAYAVLEKPETDVFLVSVILQDWTILKLLQRQPEHAKALADLRTSIVRREYDAGRSTRSSIRLLVDALSFQAKVYEDLGLPIEAQRLKQEASTLSILLQ